MLFFLLALFSGIIVMICITGIFIRMFLLVITVQYHSMSPTLEHGDRVLAIRHISRNWLRKGQIVLIWPVPGIRIPVPASYQEPPYIKRIVAMSGETFALAPDEPVFALPSDHLRTWQIPQGHVFVRGDNGGESMDSTFWGPVPFRNILAIVLMKLPRKVESAHPLPASPSEALRR